MHVRDAEIPLSHREYFNNYSNQYLQPPRDNYYYVEMILLILSFIIDVSGVGVATSYRLFFSFGNVKITGVQAK